MNKYIIGITLIFVAILAYYVWRPLGAKVRIGDTVYHVDLAVTEAQKQQGLGGRTSLGETEGMLFPYDHKEHYEFWMRNMQFSLDFIWIDGVRVVDLTENVQPPKHGERPMIVKPRRPVDKVLEVRAGTIKKHNITIGDAVVFIDR